MKAKSIILSTGVLLGVAVTISLRRLVDSLESALEEADCE